MSSYLNLSLKRSEFAWKSAETAQTDLRDSFGEYAILVKNLPTRIANNGLGQTIAFLKSKEKTKENLLLKCIGDWLINKMKIYTPNSETPDKDILQRIQSSGNDQYRWATSETMELVTWLKLHSSSLNIKEKKDNPQRKKETLSK